MTNHDSEQVQNGSEVRNPQPHPSLLIDEWSDDGWFEDWA